MKKNKPSVKEVIIVEGRDDSAAVGRAVLAETIETHGFGLSEDMYRQIERAYNSCGIIVFTDPDYGGERIRKEIVGRFPGAKEAFLDVKSATRGGDIGIENAPPEKIVEALEKVRTERAGREDVFQMEDMVKGGLVGGENSAERRRRAGELLGIGYGNGKSFLRKLNRFEISREEFEGVLMKLGGRKMAFVGTEKGTVISTEKYVVVKKEGRAQDVIEKHNHPEANVLFTVVKGRVSVTLNDSEIFELTPGKILSFDGEDTIGATLLEDSEIFVTLVMK